LKFRLHVMPRPETLDPQGRAVQSALEHMGFTVKDCRIGKSILVDVEASDRQMASHQVKEMAEKLLVNPLIETYEVEAL